MNALTRPTTRYRAIFISDIHMGTRRAQVQYLLDFLRVTESDWLYIVGDLIDNWALEKAWFWDQLHNDLIQKILRKARKGTKVIYIPGNHDDKFRDFRNLRMGRVAVLETLSITPPTASATWSCMATSMTASCAMRPGSRASAIVPTRFR